MGTNYFAPGRVNLIGEHIDYNGGSVLPIAIDMGIRATFERRSDDRILLRSATHDKVFECTTDNIPAAFSAKNDWCNYPIGVMNILKGRGLTPKPPEGGLNTRKAGLFKPPSGGLGVKPEGKLSDLSYTLNQGFQIAYGSDLPEGAGLSSSAAIEVLTAYILLHQAGGADIDRGALALLCQQAENEFIGVQCGIMDQWAVANCKKDHALLLNCATLMYEQVPFELDDYALIVINSNKPRSLIRSAYNDRKAESEEAVRLLQKAGRLTDGRMLADADMQDIADIPDPLIMRRARHVISENLRVCHAAAALRMGDLHTFGRLMNASHQSMKEDYEVTGPEMDLIAETAQNTAGCLGARMTGGGFGGCAIAIVRRPDITAFGEIISRQYRAATGLDCGFYVGTAGDGVRLLT